MSEQPARTDFRLMHRLRVRWAEVDMQRIVFNAHYLTWIDTASMDYWRELGVVVDTLPAVLGGDLFVKKSSLQYHASARMDELIDVGLRCARIGNSSMRFVAGLFRDDELLLTGEVLYVFADPVTQRSKPVPDALRGMIEAFEAGQRVVDTQVGSWSELGCDAAALRREVFVDELRIPLDLEQDARDAEATHAVVRNRLGQVLGTGRLTRDGEGVARIGRVAVRRIMRTHGHGAHLVQALVDAAATAGNRRVVLSAKTSAQAFYGRLGFAAVGEPFQEGGVAHQEMVRTLA